MARLVLTDEIWDKPQPLLPKPKGRHEKGDRMFLEAVRWIVRTGAPWRDLPQEFGPRKTVYNRYNRWAKKGHLNKILELLKKDGDHEWHMIDGTIICAHRHVTGARGGQERQKLGRSYGGFSSKIHSKMDALEMPLGFIITPGQSSDIGQAEALVEEESLAKPESNAHFSRLTLLMTLLTKRTGRGCVKCYFSR